ncbi:DUF3370 domain-containing protein [Synechococcus sp. CS-1329]|uniref:DUF3370 domain-containing protein n=1 Tax=Synechococcus sp. CS-1329 TaxID=2847975 RepID=UPI00223AB835|nr:DUF3370 domain-containing protein [Synechococcus sp. CS-1329]MCT0219887.1 DUF3370 domain-containing protein [Synechococcus sp. CS-1329]
MAALSGTAGVVLEAPAARASYIQLMSGQAARPLQGRFNAVPVLHSNQPEEVFGPGILINTAPGSAVARETGQSLSNSTFTFNGEFGLHMHHKYYPEDATRLGYGLVRGQLTLATIVINPGTKPVTLEFDRGAVRNSFEAPYLADRLMGVKPLGPRPWNTGPGDATAVIMLRNQLDSKMPERFTIPPKSRAVLFHTQLPARGIANGLLSGRSDGPFQMAVVAAEDPRSDADLIAVLDQGILAPGRIYLSMLPKIQNRQVFSRVGGVALGDAFAASISHDLSQAPLHVPFTSTNRHHFGTREIQVNELASRMVDSSLDNVGTYGVRFDVELNLKGSGPYELVFSHPTANGRQFTAFRGSIGIETDAGYGEVHVGMRSGESLSLRQLNLLPGVNNRVKVSMVYPADATPGHLLSVVPAYQLAQLRERERRVELARAAAASDAAAAKRRTAPAAAPPAVAAGQQAPAPAVAAPARAVRPPAAAPVPARPPVQPANVRPTSPPPPLSMPALVPAWLPPLPPLRLFNQAPQTLPSLAEVPVGTSKPASPQETQQLRDRYHEAADVQQRFLRQLMGR